MDTATDLLFSLSLWHWLALALILFVIEMSLGTFDLLMLAIAAAATAAWAAFGPPGMTGGGAQIIVFFIAAVVLITLGRTVLSGLRTGGPGEPLLNRRMHRLVGARGQVVGDFVAGSGRVKIGDTEWLAEAAGPFELKAGMPVVVDGARSTIVLVKPLG